MRLNLLVLTIICVLGALTTLVLQQADEPVFMATIPAEKEKEATPAPQAPDFTVTDLAGKTHTLGAYRSTPVIVHFWATWCAPCVIEFPKLVSFAQKNEGKVTIMALSSDTDNANITRFLGKHKLDIPANFIIARDPQQRVTQGLFQTYKLPESVIVDEQGILIKKMVGDQPWETSNLQTILMSP